MSIGNYCQVDPVTVKSAATVRAAAELMRQKNVGSVLVMERDHPVGILTDRDIALGVIADRLDAEKVKVKDLVNKSLITIPETASIGQAARIMRRNALRRLPVINTKGKLVGIVTSDDVLDLITSELGRLNRATTRQVPGQTAIPAPVGN